MNLKMNLKWFINHYLASMAAWFFDALFLWFLWPVIAQPFNGPGLSYFDWLAICTFRSVLMPSIYHEVAIGVRDAMEESNHA